MSTYHLVPVESENFEEVFITWMDGVMGSMHFNSEPHLQNYEQEFKIIYGTHGKVRARSVMTDLDGMQHIMKKENTDSGILVYSSDWVNVTSLRQIAGNYKSRRVTIAQHVLITSTSAENLSSIIGWERSIPDVNLLTISSTKYKPGEVHCNTYPTT